MGLVCGKICFLEAKSQKNKYRLKIKFLAKCGLFYCIILKLGNVDWRQKLRFSIDVALPIQILG